MQVRTVVVWVVLMVSGVLPSCEKPYCDTRYLDVEGLTFVARTSRPQLVAANEAVYSQELQLDIILQTRGYGLNLPRGGFSAFADCRPADYTELGDSLVITSSFDYDGQHPAGTPLNDLLTLRVNLAGGEPFQPYQADQRAVMFRQRPATSGPQQFRVYYRQTNGEVYTAETVVMNLLR
jgi:hypothetical protein